MYGQNSKNLIIKSSQKQQLAFSSKYVRETWQDLVITYRKKLIFVKTPNTDIKITQLKVTIIDL
jgi:hypothetical protein